MDYLRFCEHSDGPITITSNTIGTKPYQVIEPPVCNHMACIHSTDCKYGINSSRTGNVYEPTLME